MPADPVQPAASFDGGELDCGSGLLLLIRRHIDPLRPGELLEIVSREPSVAEDLPAWCRLTGNALLSVGGEGRERRYLVVKGTRQAPPRGEPAGASRTAAPPRPQAHPHPPAAVGAGPAPAIRPLAVMGIGSWPRPRWLLAALHDFLEGRLPEPAFHETADDAVRLAIAAQQRAGVDVLTDGEQRRDSYASFVGSRLDGCQLVPITDLLPYVDDPAAFQEQLRALDVPADLVRHPAVLGPIARSRPLAAHELAFVRTLTDAPVKVALPGPYLLTRSMWMECIAERTPYGSRNEIAPAIVRVLREEIVALLAGGAALVQLDEPVLTEVVFGHARGSRTFMCGALGEKLDPAAELAFAETLLAQTLAGFPRERLALHACRGNWTPDERAALSGPWDPLLGLLARVPVGTLFLEHATPRAGDLGALAELPRDRRIGVGVVNQKTPHVETPDEILARAERAVALLGAERVLLTPDCGFATFADNPIASAAVAEAKLAAIVAAARTLRGGV